jgi:type II secretory pathway component PulM
MNNIQSNPMLLTQSAPKSYLREMLSQWLQWAPGDGRGSTVYASKESIRAALLRANLGQLAHDQQFLEASPTTNYDDGKPIADMQQTSLASSMISLHSMEDKIGEIPQVPLHMVANL